MEISIWLRIYSLGGVTWEPFESFNDGDGTLNDIFESYENIHPTLSHVPQKRGNKADNSGTMSPPRKKQRTVHVAQN